MSAEGHNIRLSLISLWYDAAHGLSYIEYMTYNTLMLFYFDVNFIIIW